MAVTNKRKLPNYFSCFLEWKPTDAFHIFFSGASCRSSYAPAANFLISPNESVEREMFSLSGKLCVNAIQEIEKKWYLYTLSYTIANKNQFVHARRLYRYEIYIHVWIHIHICMYTCAHIYIHTRNLYTYICDTLEILDIDCLGI